MPESPPGKLADHLLELARPMLDGLGRAPTADDVEKLLPIAVTIWNAAVLDRWGLTPDLVARTRATLAALPEDLQPLVDHLLDRKTERWPDDLRAIGDWEIVRTEDGDWHLRVEGHERPPTDA